MSAPGTPAAATAIVAEFRRVADAASSRGLTLRAAGSVGIHVHLAEPQALWRLGRPAPNDLDLVARAAERNDCRRLFEDLGYEVDRELLMTGEGKRFGFERPADGMHVDLFIDRLEMCHTIELRDRLALQPETLPLADLLLQKLQIVEINRKDLLDITVLLVEHDLGAEAPEDVDLGYIARLLADDWGFWHTVSGNVGRAEAFARELEMEPTAQRRVVDRLQRLSSALEDHPKTRRWKLRARIGTKKKWYQDVGEGTGAF
jgi:hypothetical protein